MEGWKIHLTKSEGVLLLLIALKAEGELHMAIKLAPNERLIKEWDYSYSRRGRENAISNLIITDRRVIHYTNGNKGNSTSEVLIDKCKSWEIVTHHQKPRRIILIILAIIFIAAGISSGILLYQGMSYMSWVIGGPMCLVGILLIIIAVLLKSKHSFFFVLNLEGHTSPGLSLSRIFAGKRNNKSLWMAVDPDKTEDILSTFGAAIVASNAKK